MQCGYSARHDCREHVREPGHITDRLKEPCAHGLSPTQRCGDDQYLLLWIQVKSRQRMYIALRVDLPQPRNAAITRRLGPFSR